MKTCRITQCGDIPRCHLEENGNADLCPKLKLIREEAIQVTEQKWKQKQQVRTVVMKEIIGTKIRFTNVISTGVPVSLDRFEGTGRMTGEIQLDVALGRVNKLRTTKQTKANKQTTRKKLIAEFMEKNGFTPVEPKLAPELQPEPWIPMSETNWFNQETSIEDRCIYIPLAVDEGKSEPYSPVITKGDNKIIGSRIHEKKLIKFHDDRAMKLVRLQNMGF